MRNSYPLTSLTVLALATLVACGTSTSEKTSAPDENTTNGVQKLMQRASSCDDLDYALRAEARLQLAKQIEQSQPSVASGAARWGGVGGSATMVPSNAASGGVKSATGQAVAIGDSADSASGAGESTNYSETNTQVKGIDEADIIKSDGTHLYVARNQELKISRAYPASSMSVIATQPIEGSVREMYVVPGSNGSTVVVYSAVDAAGLYDEANIPRPKNSAGVYGAPMIDCFDCSSYYQQLPATKVTALSLANGAVTVQKEIYYEGSYLSSRRNGVSVRTTLQVPSRAPVINVYPDEASRTKAMLLALDELQKGGRPIAEIPSEEVDELVQKKLSDVVITDAEASIQAITHDDWLPRTFERKNGALTADTLPCQSFYIPASGSTSAGVTFIAQLDISSMLTGANNVAMLGLADTMYENASTVVLSSRYWNYAPEAGEAVTQTLVHQFDVSQPGTIAYQASGTVPGYILNQFALDESGGALRIVTTDDGSSDSNRATSAGIYVLQPQASNLKTVGKLEGLAKSERVYAVRFLKDKAYIVTFRQVDPLFVLDLSEPTTPKLLGELKIPGFSEYMHPLGDNHLLTIGRNATETGRAGDLALQIFDVTNPINPALAHKYDFTMSGSSEAEHNHKAFSFFDELGMLAIPFWSGTWNTQYGYMAQNTLELFAVDVNSGFKYLGALDGNSVLPKAEQGGTQYYCDYPNQSSGTIERGMYIQDTLYAVGQRGIIASALAAPTTPTGVLPFDSTDVPENCWASGEGGAGGTTSIGTGGSSGFTTPSTGGVPTITPTSGGAPNTTVAPSTSSTFAAPGGAGGAGGASGAGSVSAV
ncbi:MAG TPA: beta-propeller domain-containing protein [Polyangiaceae bacterium]|nr:beta-propeller domain-containing protein [Polyangiaceae bacterium]